MIDNVLNNMPPKKEPYLEYFATECDEFHDMGAYEKVPMLIRQLQSMKNIGRIQKQLISDAMQQMLEDGEVDMVTSARKTPDREEKFDFSRPIGTNYGMLTVRSDNSTIVDGNYSTYNGMRVALLNGNIWRNLWILKR